MDGEPIQVLLVEDNPDDALSISEMLTESGEGQFQLTHVLRLADALEAIRETEFDVFLVDLVLPDSAGGQTLERIRSVDLPIIVVTGHVRDELALDLYLSGAQDYLIKGKIDGRVLSLAIRYAVERFRFLTSEERQLHVIQRLEQTNHHLKRAAEHDPLTGLLNRRGVENVLGVEASRSVRAGSELAAVVFDCDDFKSVNDSHGHATGDSLLRSLTKRMQKVCRPTDHLARIGGDEFLALLPDTRVREAKHVAERMRRVISEVPHLGPKSIRMSASFAVTPVDPEHATVRSILVATRVALRVGKSSGKNRVESASAALAGGCDAADRLALSRLRVVRQPIYDLWKHRLLGFELLSRGPGGDLESPAHSLFLSLERDALRALDLECLGRCVASTGSLPASAKVHVNLFPATIAEAGAQRILHIIRQKGGRRRFCIEINERQFLGDPSSLRKHVAELKEAGLQIAIDDVGFGRSVLETLILLEPDVVKVDRRHVHGAAEDMGKQRSLRRLLNVASTLECETIAEGIETRADLEAVTDVGIRYGQGFLWGKPSETATGEWTAG